MSLERARHVEENFIIDEKENCKSRVPWDGLSCGFIPAFILTSKKLFLKSLTSKQRSVEHPHVTYYHIVGKLATYSDSI